ncbi:MAG: hypothetical protein ACK2U9_19405 [Anaerolineae bacterium]
MALINRGLAALLVCLLGAQAALAEPDQMGIDLDAAYSATRIIESSDGRLEIQEHRAPGRYRMEFQVQDETMVYVVREEEDEAYMLLPSLQLAVSVPALKVRELSGQVEVLEREAAGREEVNGHDAGRYRARFRDPRGGVAEGYYWLTDEGIPVRMDMTYQDPDVGNVDVLMELEDLEVGDQDPSLFAVPDGYQVVSGLDGLLGR